MPPPVPGSPVIIDTPGEVLLATGQTYGRIISRPTVPCMVQQAGSGPKPIIADPYQLMDLNAGQGGMYFRGIQFRGEDMNRMIGAVAMNGIENVTFEECDFEGCAAGLSCSRQDGSVPGQMRVRISGCSFRGCGAIGAFFNSVQGLLVEYSLFDNNGWGDGSITRYPADQSHGSYFIGVANSSVQNCLFTRNRMNGMRGCGQDVRGNLFIDNACGIAAGADAMRISDNIVLWSHDHDPANGGRWGVGIDLNGGFNTLVERNIIAHNRGTANIGGISVHGRYEGVRLMHNTVIGWDMEGGIGTAYRLGEHGRGANWRTNSVTCQLHGGPEVYGDGQDLWNNQYNRVVVPEQIVNPYADPIMWAERVLGRAGLTAEQAIEATVVEFEKSRQSIHDIRSWYKDQFRIRT